jgi:hypothetical protein
MSRPLALRLCRDNFPQDVLKNPRDTTRSSIRKVFLKLVSEHVLPIASYLGL